jgi:hypothetical protein
MELRGKFIQRVTFYRLRFDFSRARYCRKHNLLRVYKIVRLSRFGSKELFEFWIGELNLPERQLESKGE